MDSRQSLSGAELHLLYLEDKTSNHFTNPENIKSLLNYTLNNMEGKIDSNLEMEIIDFCVDKIRDDTTLDEERIQFLRDKYNLIEKEQEYQRKIRRIKRYAAAAAVFVVMVGGICFGGARESKAGIIEWITSLFVVDKGEQLSLGTGDMNLETIEIKEGHLPESLPNEFVFDSSRTSSSSLQDSYLYRFYDTTKRLLMIEINEYSDSHFPTNKEIETKNNSSETKTKGNTTYYYSSNESRNSISWIYDNNIYTIRGEFDFSELEEILSFYEEDQNIE